MDKDTLDLLNLFPVVVWIQICGNFDNVSTYFNVCASSHFLKALLQRQRTVILFPEVARIVYQHQAELKNRSDAVNLMKQCRPVCKHWKWSVGELLGNLEENFNFTSLRGMVPVQPYQFTGFSAHTYFDLENYAKIDKFKQTFTSMYSNGFKNPFVSRAVTVRLSGIVQTAVCANFIEFLREFGQHVHFIGILLHNSAELTTFEKLLEILRLLPNVKVVCIDCMELRIRLSSIKKISRICKRTPIPTLSKLQFIKTRGFPTVLNEQFWTNNPQVRKVECHHAYSNVIVGCVSRIPLPNLQELCVRFRDNNTFEDFENSSASWPLKCLDLTTNSTTFETVIRCVQEKFGQTLEKLRLWVHHSDQCEEFVDTLTFPKLRVFDLKMQDSPCLDFLLSFQTTLEDLILETRNVPLASKEKVLKIYTYGTKLYLSNAWILFPKLKTLTLCTDHGMYISQVGCTRQEWYIYGGDKRYNVLK